MATDIEADRSYKVMSSPRVLPQVAYAALGTKSADAFGSSGVQRRYCAGTIYANRKNMMLTHWMTSCSVVRRHLVTFRPRAKKTSCEGEFADLRMRRWRVRKAVAGGRNKAVRR
jgi:hypothetical protein